LPLPVRAIAITSRRAVTYGHTCATTKQKDEGRQPTR